MGNIVVIDTETTWTDQVMSIGAVIADSSCRPIDSRYYPIDNAENYCDRNLLTIGVDGCEGNLHADGNPEISGGG